MRRVPNILLAIGVVVVASLGFSAFKDMGDYEVSVTLDNATNVVVGAPIRIKGFEAGSVTDITVKEGQAKITFEVNEDFAPLHDGAEAVVGWKATLSERQIEISDGRKRNAKIPDGGMLRGDNATPVELGDVLNALDPQTRKKLQGSLGALSQSLKGAESETNETIKHAGGALRELSSVLKAVGTDGPAIRTLVTRMNDLVSALARRDDDVRAMVSELNGVADEVSSRRTQLREGLQELPPTLRQADTTLTNLSGTVDEVVPLLQELKPATKKLGPVASDLRPLLLDLRPLVNEVRPALGSTSQLLNNTPALLNNTHDVLPQVETLAGESKKPVAFLRPYAPEVVSFFTTWNSSFSNWDNNGNFARIYVQAGATSPTVQPGIVPPGHYYDPYPKPGALVSQAWTDAAGSEIQ